MVNYKNTLIEENRYERRIDMKEEENVAFDYEKNYYMMMDEMNKKLEYQKEEYEKEKKKLEKELQFYKKIIKSVLNIRD